MVSGAGAVVESNKGPMNPVQLEACLLSTADRVGPRWMFGARRLNVLSALTCP